MQLLDYLFDIIIGHTPIFSVRGIPGDVIFKQTQTPYDVPGNWPSVERGVWLSKLASYAGGTVHGSPEKCYDSHIISKTDDEVFERVAKWFGFRPWRTNFTGCHEMASNVGNWRLSVIIWKLAVPLLSSLLCILIGCLQRSFHSGPRKPNFDLMGACSIKNWRNICCG